MKSRKKKINLNLEYGLSSFLFTLIPVGALIMSIHTRQLPLLIISHYQNIPHVVFWIQAIITSLIGMFFLFLFLLNITKSIHGIIVYTFLPQWFIFHRLKYSQKKYIEFLERCVRWSQTGLPKLSKYKRNRYNSPLAGFNYLQTKLILNRYSNFRSMAKQQLKKYQGE